MTKQKEAHRANYEILTNRSAPNWDDNDARALNGMFGHEVILSDGERLLLHKLNPDSVVLRDRFAEQEDIRLRQMQNAAFSLLFSLAPARVIEGRRLILPGGYVESSIRPLKHDYDPCQWQNEHPWPPAPQLLSPKNDGADQIRALVGIANYAIELLKTYRHEELIPVAAEKDNWPCSVPTPADARSFRNYCEAFAQWAEKTSLAKNSPIKVRKKADKEEANRRTVILHELRDIHRYLVNPDAWNEGRDWYIDKETGEMREQPTKWQEMADEDEQGENKLAPLGGKTWKSWRDVIWAKLNEERPAGLHLGSKFPSLIEVDQALTEIGLDGARERVRDNWLKQQGTNRRIGYEERESVRENAEKLQAKDGVWIGKMAKRFNVDGQEINASAARGRIRRQLELALKHLVK